jgi:hypothetical protein
MSLPCDVNVVYGNGSLAARSYEGLTVDFSSRQTVLYMVGDDKEERKIAEMDMDETYYPVGPFHAVCCLGTVRGMSGPEDEIWYVYLTGK